MKPDRLLYLSTHRMSAYLWKANLLSSEGDFAPTADGYQALSAYLAENSGSVFSILVNVAEESFQIETIPFLRGTDRQAIIQRKLGQHFFGIGLTASQSIGYQQTQRKNERVLLAALSNKDFFAPWLKCIERAEVKLLGIYSLPFLAPSLLKKSQRVEDQCLLLTVQDQSIRQSYFEKGELLFSRLSPLPNNRMSELAKAFASEAHKLQQYLSSQRLIGRNQRITAHVLANKDALKAIQVSCMDSETLHFNVLDIEDCATKSKLNKPPPNTHCEQIFLNLLVTSPPRTQFADDTLRHPLHLHQIRTAWYACGALVLLICVLFAGTRLYETHRLGQETEALWNEAAQSRQRYESIIKDFPSIPISTETLRRVVDRYAALDVKNSTPMGLYLEISRALQVAPTVEIESIDWSSGSSDLSPTRASGPASTPVTALSDSESATVHGSIRLGVSTNPRQILDVFNHFLEALKSSPKYAVIVLKRPFDIESDKSLKGADTTVEDNKPRSFSLRLIRKVES